MKSSKICFLKSDVGKCLLLVSVSSCTVAKIRNIYLFSVFFCMVSCKKSLSNSITPLRMLSKPVETNSIKEFKRPSDQLFPRGAGYWLLAYSPLKKTRKINKKRTWRSWKDPRVYQAFIKQLNFLNQDVTNGNE